MNDVHVKGLAELQKFLDQVPAKMEKNIMRGGLRAGMKVVLPVAKNNIHSVSGELARGLKIRTNGRGGKVWASLSARGKHGYIAKFLEYGTRAHRIVGKVGSALNVKGQMVRAVEHPGINPKPFLRPAMDSQAGAAVVAMGNYIKNRLAKKNGLDTSDIDIGVEK